MANIGRGMIAGFVATAVLSTLMILKQMMGMMPDLNVIAMLTKMAGGSSPIVGWVIHFAIGTVAWGGVFALFHDRIPGGSMIVRGIIFGIGAWLLMMVAVMPLAGAGFFGLGLGMPAPIMTLVLHIVFGATLGAVYARRRVPVSV